MKKLNNKKIQPTYSDLTETEKAVILKYMTLIAHDTKRIHSRLFKITQIALGVS